MTEVPALPPLEGGQYPVRFTDEDWQRLKDMQSRPVVTTADLGDRLANIERDMEKVLSVISQLESFIAQVMPAVDQITANPAKFLMSLMGGGRRG